LRAAFAFLYALGSRIVMPGDAAGVPITIAGTKLSGASACRGASQPSYAHCASAGPGCVIHAIADYAPYDQYLPE